MISDAIQLEVVFLDQIVNIDLVFEIIVVSNIKTIEIVPIVVLIKDIELEQTSMDDFWEIYLKIKEEIIDDEKIFLEQLVAIYVNGNNLKILAIIIFLAVENLVPSVVSIFQLIL